MRSTPRNEERTLSVAAPATRCRNARPARGRTPHDRPRDGKLDAVVSPGPAGRADRSSQNQAYKYITQVYQRDMKAGDRLPVTNPGAWLAQLGQNPPAGRGTSPPGVPRSRTSAARRSTPGSARMRMSRSSPRVARSCSGSLGAGGQSRPCPDAAAGAAGAAHPDPACVRRQTRALRAGQTVDRRSRRRVTRGGVPGPCGGCARGHLGHRDLAHADRQDPGVTDPCRIVRVPCGDGRPVVAVAVGRPPRRAPPRRHGRDRRGHRGRRPHPADPTRRQPE